MRSRSGLMSTLGCSSVKSSQSRSFFLSLRHGVSTSMPRPDTMLRRLTPCQAPGHAAIAPSRMRQRGVGDQQVLADVVLLTQPVAAWAGPGRGVRRERLRLQPGRTVGIGAGARVEHPHQVRQRRQRADAGARARGATPLLERHGRRQAGDLLHVRGADLLQQPTRIGRHRLEVATLRLGVERAEGERGLARAGDAGEGHHGVTWDVDVDVLEVVLAGSADMDEGVARVVVHTPCLAAPRLVHTIGCSAEVLRPQETTTASGVVVVSRIRTGTSSPTCGGATPSGSTRGCTACAAARRSAA